MTDLIKRLRDSAKAARALDRHALLMEAADELELCCLVIQWLVLCRPSAAKKKKKPARRKRK